MKFLFGTVLAFVFLFLFAWGSQGLSADNASRNQPIKKMNLKTFKNLKGRFDQVKVLNELQVQIKTQGSFEVKRLQAETSVFHWNVEKPKPSKVCLDHSGIVMDSAGQKKKISFSEIGPESGQQIQSLLKLMSSDPKQLVEDFEVTENPAQLGAYFLKPLKPETVFFQKAELHINKAGLVDSIKLIEKSQDELQIQFSDLQTDKANDIKSCVL